MNVNPLARLRNWLSAAIDWRVREEVKPERELVSELAASLRQSNIDLTDQIRVQNAVIENLQERIKRVEEQLSN